MRLMVIVGYLSVRGSNEWKCYDALCVCVCGTKETEIHVLFECKCYDMVMRRWMRTWSRGEEKNNGPDKIICGGERCCGERDNEIYRRSMDRKTKE